MAKILIVEDDRDLGGMIVDWLRFEHYNVEIVYDGTEGWERLQSFEYDVIVLDWELPGIDGINMCKQYRARGGASLPVLGLSARQFRGQTA